MTKLRANCIFLIIIFSYYPLINAQKGNELNEICLSLLELEVEKVRNTANKLGHPCVKDALLKIASSLDERGTPIELLNCPFDMTMDQSFFFEVAKGYAELTKRNYGNSNAFKHFVEAHKLSQRIDNQIYEKYILGVILEQIRNQIFIGSNQFESYLERLDSLTTSNTDYIVLELNKTILFSKADDTLGYNINRYEKAISALDSLFLIEKNSSYLPYYLHEKGVQNKLIDDYAEAEIYFLKVDHLISKRGVYQELRATNYWQLSDTYILANNFEKAKFYWNKSKENAISLRDTFYDNRLGAKVLKGLGRFQESLDLLEQSNQNEYEISAKSYSFMSNQLSSQFREELEVKYRLAQKEKEYLIEKQKATLSKNWLRLTLLLLFLAMGIAVLLQKYTDKKRLLAEQDSLLKQKHVQTLIKEQELISIDAMIMGQEKERKRVADELHDDLGSLMATIKLHFESFESSLDSPSIKNAKRLIDEAYLKIRGMAHSKNMGLMNDQGLLIALKRISKILSETNSIQVSVLDFGMNRQLDNTRELTLFRVIQELLTNVIKHAKATEVLIQLTQHKESLNILVEDNGIGFDYDSLKDDYSSMGLKNIKKKINYLEGSLVVDSQFNKGTTIIIDIPS